MREGRSRTIVSAKGNRFLTALMAAVLIAVGLQACAATAKQAPPAVSLKAGTELAHFTAPPFTLHDQTGAAVTLQQMRGQVVLLTFLDATCTTECPITAQYLDWTSQFLGKDSGRVVWLAMSVNPTNTVADAETFLHKNSVKVPLHVLLGNQAELAPLWKAYHIVVQPGADGDVQHTLGLYLIDGQGHEREWVDGGYDPKALGADIQSLLHEEG